MSAVKSMGSKIEHSVSKILRKEKIAYQSHPGNLPGKPDFRIKGVKSVIFVDSCFWHGCRYHCARPKTNMSFWKRKIAANKKRDRVVNAQYKRNGWSVIRIWEHSISKSGDKLTSLLRTAKK